MDDIPRDLDGDGVFEDVNGDGNANVTDVTRLFVVLDDIDDHHRDALDMTGTGGVNVVDVTELFTTVVT